MKTKEAKRGIVALIEDYKAGLMSHNELSHHFDLIIHEWIGALVKTMTQSEAVKEIENMAAYIQGMTAAMKL